MAKDPFATLAETVDDQWRQAEYRHERFPEIAAAALTRHWAALESITLEELFARVLVTDSACSQRDSNFGEPPVIVFRNERFFIEVLPWLDVVPGVHQHAFEGAFALLKGSSLHTTFSFRAGEHHGKHLVQGQLVPDRVELLRLGDVRTIDAGSKFIHSTFHLDLPSVSIVVRTWGDESGGPQFAYSLVGGIGWDPRYKPELLDKRLRMLRTLERLEAPLFDSWLERTIEHVEPFSALWLALEFESHLSRVNIAGSRHAPLLKLASLEAEERRRIDCLTALRRKLASRDQRFFVALLLNVWGKSRFLDLVAQQYPERDPVDCVLQWIRELAVDTDCEMLLDGRAVSLRFKPQALEIVRRMLTGKTGEHDATAIAGAERQAIEALNEAFRESRVFRSLFFEPPRALTPNKG